MSGVSTTGGLFLAPVTVSYGIPDQQMAFHPVMMQEPKIFHLVVL